MPGWRWQWDSASRRSSTGRHMSFGKGTGRRTLEAECAGAECQLVHTRLKEFRSGFPRYDIQQGCVLSPIGSLITVLHVVKSCGRLYCSKTATTTFPIPQALWQWDLANTESNSHLLQSGQVLVTCSTNKMWQKWWDFPNWVIWRLTAFTSGNSSY